jgi:hypothetical protein
VVPLFYFIRKIVQIMVSAMVMANLRFLPVRSFREGERVGSQALPLVPWKHAWAGFMSNVIVVGAYWWCFFITTLVPVQSEVVEQAPKPVSSDPVLVHARRPPDKSDSVPLLTHDELILSLKVTSVLLLMAKEGYAIIPMQHLLVWTALLVSYTVYQDSWVRLYVVTVIRWAYDLLITVIFWALMAMAAVWYWTFYIIAVFEAYFIRPYIQGWVDDIAEACCMIVTFSVDVWLTLESTVLWLLLTPSLSFAWVPVVILVHFLKRGLRFY